MSKRVVVLGAGVAGAQVLKQIHPFIHGSEHSLVVVDKNNHSTFAPMLHEVATGAVSPQHITHPIRGIIHCCLERFYQAGVEAIDLDQKIVKTSEGDISYDYLITAIGARTNHFGTPGADQYCLNLKTMHDSLKVRRHIIDSYEMASRLPSGKEREKQLHFVIIGGGYTGVEMAGQLADLLMNEMKELYGEVYPDEAKITLIHAGDRILPVLKEKSSQLATKRLEALGVRVLVNSKATSVTPEGVSLMNGEVLESKTVIWTAGVVACGDELFATDRLEKSRVKVKSTLQIPDHPEVFVLGDLAYVIDGDGPHPQTGQVAFDQAKLVAKNLRNSFNGEPLEAFSYHHKGDLVPIGNRWAVAEIYGIRIHGFVAWWLRRTVYLQGLFSWSDRVRVVFDWTMNLFSKRDTTRL